MLPLSAALCSLLPAQQGDGPLAAGVSPAVPLLAAPRLQGYDFTTKEYTCPTTSNGTAAPSGAPAAGGGTTTPVNTAAQPLTIEMDVTGEPW